MPIEKALMATRLHGHPKSIEATELFLNLFFRTSKRLEFSNTMVIQENIYSTVEIMVWINKLHGVRSALVTALVTTRDVPHIVLRLPYIPSDRNESTDSDRGR